MLAAVLGALRRRRTYVALLAGLTLPGWIAVSSAAANPMCGETVTSNVTLTGDLDCSGSDTNGLNIGKNGITINLGGYSITGPGGAAGTYVGINNNGYSSVTVENGTIQDYYFDVSNFESKTATYSHLRLYTDGTKQYYPFYDLNSTATKLSYSLTENGYAGIDTDNTSSDQISYDSDIGSEYGIYIPGDQKTTYTDNTLQGETDGVYFYDLQSSPGLSFTGNVITPTSSGDGFYEYGQALGAKFTNNRVYGGAVGYELWTAPVTVSDNLASGQSSYGFYFSSNSTGSSGKYTGNVVSDNRAVLDLNGFYDSSSYGSKWTGNTAEGNSNYGIWIKYPLDYAITGNTAKGNGATGIYLEDNSGDQPTSFSGNLAVGNDSYGLGADFPLSTMGMNTAYNNYPSDCVNVTCSS